MFKPNSLIGPNEFLFSSLHRLQSVMMCEDCGCDIDDGDKCPDCLQQTFEVASEFNNENNDD